MVNKKTSITVLQVSKSTIQAHICINRSYRHIYDVIKRFNAKMSPRRGFGFLEPADMPKQNALWCIQINNNKTGWINKISKEGNFIEESRQDAETPLAFQKRVSKDEVYSVGVQRLCFVKINGMYRFLGVYVVSQFDFDRQTVVLKRTNRNLLEVKMTKRVKNTIVIETEETIEETHII